MANKVTKREMFNAIKAVLMGENTSFTPDEMVAAIDHEIELLDKKSANKKPTKTQEANEGVKATIVDVLAESDKPMTVSEILATKKFEDGTSNQKISALLKQLVDGGVVVKAIEKKVSYFSLNAEEEVVEEEA